ncbi:hypothetical protein AUC69_15610 [Methyloceanibacter superfactus]|uniref:Malto-oligosyltrehalose synthase n=1 Tax=Methyloceanibacter superfactus TaxID=1774969 RepID=A0A1E3VRM7_9HYPH|nr:hypothetical protein [Methyloceanibacter superfactus]ODR96183.1 hypothetical protein AUC69_15610 [Methyloceanibacter superfactus]
MPEAWAAAVHRWTAQNAEFRREADGLTMPEPEVEWMFYQALAGAWPADLACDDADGLAALADRMAQFMLKAVREAKAHTSWTAQNADYESAVERFTRDALDPAKAPAFLQNFAAMCGPVFLAGALNSLSQTAIKLTAPGVPDIYQGSELWELSLVDPDNRRAVDYDTCRALQASVGDAAPEALLADWRSGALKLRLLQAGLALRARGRDLFAGGAYVPLSVEGDAAEHVLAFARIADGQAVVTIVPRMPLGLLSGESTPLVPTERWGDTVAMLPDHLAGQRWRDVVTGQVHAGQARLAVGEVLGRFPVALLANQSLQE